jgi:hypothetical protein
VRNPRLVVNDQNASHLNLPASSEGLFALPNLSRSSGR